METEASAATARAVELEAGRGALLLTGDASAVQRGEAALAEARQEADRLGAMAEAMRAHLAKTLTSEKAAKIREAVKAIEVETAAFVEFWRTKYPALAQQIAEGMAHLKADEAARGEFSRLSVDYTAFEEAAVKHPQRIEDILFPDHFPGTTPAINLVLLPAVEGAPPPWASVPAIWQKGR